jgi:hypothetical protein
LVEFWKLVAYDSAPRTAEWIVESGANFGGCRQAQQLRNRTLRGSLI